MWNLASACIESVLITRPQERLRSIVMSISVCLSVREDISGTTHAIFTNLFLHVAYVCGLVLLAC